MYTIEDRRIVFIGGASHTFNDIIAEVVPFDEILVVRLENQGWKRSNENVFGLDYKGRVIWKIETRVHAFPESHYINLYRRNELVDAYNWDGTILSLAPKTGEIMMESLIYSSTKRQIQKHQII